MTLMTPLRETHRAELRSKDPWPFDTLRSPATRFQGYSLYPLALRPGSWLEYRVAISGPTSRGVRTTANRESSIDLPSSCVLGVEITGTGREVLFANGQAGPLAYETPLCSLYIDGTQLASRAQMPLTTGKVGYPTTTAFWKQLAQSTAGDTHIAHDGPVIVVTQRKPRTDGAEAAALEEVHTLIIDRDTGIMLQGHGSAECEQSYCLLLIRSHVILSPGESSYLRSPRA